MQSVTSLQVDKQLFAGVDVGGTKVAIVDNASEAMHRYVTASFPNMEAVLDDYFAKLGRRPAAVTLAMAGPRDDETGAITLSNGHWPAFQPLEAMRRYKGTRFETVNDMVGTAAGVLAEPRIAYAALKEGKASPTGTKLIMAVSTGVGAAAAVWDARTKRHVFMASEAGHIGIQPANDEEMSYLRYLHTKYPRASAELALSGKFGIGHLVDHALLQQYDTDLIAALERARVADRPIGAVLLEFATEGEGTSKQVAQKVLGQLGGMLGAVMRDLAAAFVPTGGIYLTGSVALALGEYLAQNTELLERFVHPGAMHDSWLQRVPIYLVTDPHVAVKGALSLAQQD